MSPAIPSPLKLAAAAAIALAGSISLFAQSDSGAPSKAPPPSGSAPSAPKRQRVPHPLTDEGPVTRDERAEQVLQAAIKAHGGLEAIMGRQTIYMKSTIKNFEFPEPQTGTLTVWFKRPSKLRQEIAYPARKEIRVLDGDRAWVDVGKGPQLLSPIHALMFQRGVLELDSPVLYNQGDLRYLSVATDPHGRMTQKLSWSYQGYQRDLMVDNATSRILVIGEFGTPAGATSRMRLFDDYRPVQGIMLPFHQEVLRNNQKYTETDLIEAKFNLPIEDSLFVYTGPEPQPGQETAPGRPKGKDTDSSAP